MTRYEILDVLTSYGKRQFSITHLLPSGDDNFTADYQLVSLEGEYIIVKSMVTGNKVPLRLERIQSITKLEGANE